VKRIWNEYPALREYDSGVGLVLLPSAYSCDGCGHQWSIDHLRAVHPNAKSCCPERKMGVWSKVAQIEIDWALAHHVLVITAETADTVPQKEWHNHALNEALREGNE